jgi:hypothetical protein
VTSVGARWKINKIEPDSIDDPLTPWFVCQVNRNGLHKTRYRGSAWEHCAVWLAIEYRERRRERAAEILTRGEEP